MKTTILVNKAKCDNCSSIIESTHVHDFVSCSCGRLCVDGGKEYLKRSGYLDNYTEMSMYGCLKCGKVLTDEMVDDHIENCKGVLNAAKEWKDQGSS